MEKRKESLGFYCGALFFCFYFTFGIFGSRLTIYRSELGKTPVEIAVVLSASGIFAIALQPDVYKRQGQNPFALFRDGSGAVMRASLHAYHFFHFFGILHENVLLQIS